MDLLEDYETVRTSHYDSLKERQFIPISAARQKAEKLDFMEYKPGKQHYLCRQIASDSLICSLCHLSNI